ncbi:MAG: alpha-amylase family glycosyl hydrolase [Anaerolineae bacterium]|nr:alpha-amylase family glycosyl hydrolase [Anaerolineae bacterium]
MSELHWRWWQRGVIYQIYPRSYKDSNHDGTGDLQGIIEKLDYLNDGTENSLGVDAIWISPFFPSPMKDAGYDVANYVDVDPLFGDLATFDRLIAAAHERNIKIIIDYVPNHSSDRHPWFIESRSSRTNPKRDWYIWQDARPDGSPPNNWGSVFGGKAWTWDDTTQQYYFHQFDPSQPDLNWRNPAVKAAMLDVLRFWLDRGVDGIRMDVIYMVWKHPDMPDQPLIPGAAGRGPDDLFGRQQHLYDYNYEGIHSIMQEIRTLFDAYPGDRLSIGEIWLDLPERMKYYGNNDELHLPFNFGLISSASFLEETPWSAADVRRIVDEYEAALPAFGWGNWVMGNHDTPRLASRLGSHSKARTAALLLLTLRGTPTIYMGEEIGMVNGDIPPDKIDDPQGLRLGAAYTRDKCRTPFQWDGSDYAGFSTVPTWLPVNPDYPLRNVAGEWLDERSMLTLYRRLLWLRRRSMALSVGSYEPLESPEGTYVYVREYGPETMLIALNFTGEVLLNTLLDRQGMVSGMLELRPQEGVLVRLD